MKNYWVWKFEDGRFDIETLREDRWACEGFVCIRYSEFERDTKEKIFKRIGGKAVEVKLLEVLGA